MEYEVIETADGETVIKRTRGSEVVFIPMDEKNRDYQEYINSLES